MNGHMTVLPFLLVWFQFFAGCLCGGTMHCYCMPPGQTSGWSLGCAAVLLQYSVLLVLGNFFPAELLCSGLREFPLLFLTFFFASLSASFFSVWLHSVSCFNPCPHYCVLGVFFICFFKCIFFLLFAAHFSSLYVGLSVLPALLLASVLISEPV